MLNDDWQMIMIAGQRSPGEFPRVVKLHVSILIPDDLLGMISANTTFNFE